MSATLYERSTIAPNPLHQDELRELAEFLARTPTATKRRTPRLVSPDGSELVVPEEVFDVLVQVVGALSQGRGVSVVPTNAQLTTQQAADHLGMSRPTLVKLLESGEIPFTKVGRHRRVTLNDLVSYEERVREQRRDALAALTYDASLDGSYFRNPSTSQTR